MEFVSQDNICVKLEGDLMKFTNEYVRLRKVFKAIVKYLYYVRRDSLYIYICIAYATCFIDVILLTRVRRFCWFLRCNFHS